MRLRPGQWNRAEVTPFPTWPTEASHVALHTLSQLLWHLDVKALGCLKMIDPLAP